ncbi:hypothetical protein [Nostocoides sp. Soil756]|uniref:hypothetical protein n=1 Tax=Nostocoides sp. Soil756 TaxID=1736399 RepID=UPI0006FD3EF8|nr:hypothetical protein [Tetrasphaera sp. Soil756]KRE60855.1 hypothetical protein ASG78_10765 [Tetrasphaera sp. Soil756]
MRAVLLAVVVAAAVLAWPSGNVGRRPGATEVRAVVRAVGRLRGRFGRHRATAPGGWVADLAEVVAVGLRAGLDLPGALRVATTSPSVRSAAPWLGERCTTSASPVVALLEPPPAVDARTRSDLAVLARAWRVSEATGAAASHTTAAAAASVRARHESERRVGAALAGPRASMRLLTLLPLGGPLVGLLLGIDPVSLYGTAAARWAGVGGLVLTATGWSWSAALVRRAQRPADTSGAP